MTDENLELEVSATMPSIDETIAFIQSAHAGQVDKDGTAYWQHPVAIMPVATRHC